VKEAFKQTDDEAYEWILARILTSGTGEDRRSRDWLASGCSAIFALLIGSQLFVANCGSQMYIFYLGNSCRKSYSKNALKYLNEIEPKFMQFR
jgi:hypothetical protein